MSGFAILPPDSRWDRDCSSHSRTVTLNINPSSNVPDSETPLPSANTIFAYFRSRTVYGASAGVFSNGGSITMFILSGRNGEGKNDNPFLTDFHGSRRDDREGRATMRINLDA